MTDTIKTNEDVIPRRRASDWQKPPSAARGNVFDWFEGDGAVILEERARARVSAALDGAKTIADVLMQAAIDREEDDQDSPLRLSENVEHGLLDALASCIEVAEVHTGDISPCWTTSPRDDEEAQAIAATVRSINAARYRKEAGKGGA